jgi:plasmid segregation protein ParM
MNITLGGKYKSDIPVIMTLAEIAAHVIEKYFSEYKTLPEGAIVVNAKHSGAIPASEYTRERADILEKRFKEKPHNLSVYVGNNQVSIQVNIEESHVTQEGIPLLYALLEADPSMFNQFNSDYKLKITPKKYFLDKRIFHLDIGDGTTEEIVTQGLNPVAGSGVRLGGGHAIQAAAAMLEKNTDGFVRYNRQQFQDAVKDKTNVHHEKCVNYLAETRYEQAHQIFEDVQEKFMSIAQGNVDLFTVYGGGSIEFEGELRNKLKAFAEQVGAKLLWIPAEDAIDLQAKGLNILNKNVFYKGDK